MSAWLGEHPQIFMSNPKEPFFFSTDIHMSGNVKTLDEYLRIFNNAGDQHLKVGEASTTYLQSYVAVSNILGFNPVARFIVMLRNPIDLAQSYHGELRWANQQVLDDFEEDWKARYVSKLKLGKLDRHSLDPVLLEYDKVCKLGEQVQRLLQTVDAKSLLFIVMDDLISDPLQEYQRVLEFLNVPYDGKNLFPIYNPAKQPRFNMVRKILLSLYNVKRLLGIRWSFGVNKMVDSFNTKPYKSLPLRPDFKQELIEVFKEDVNLLSALLGRDFTHWLR